MTDTTTKSPPPGTGPLPSTGELHHPFIAERYEVINTLKGGMGIVYLCRDHFTSQLVALKTFKPEFLPNRAARDLFLREGTMWVEMGKHPNIVQAYRVERLGDGSEVYLVLEWIVQPKDKASPSLRSWLKPGRPLPPEQALLFCLHVARGMQYATRKIPGLVHRDMKPENILVGYDKVARVTDFGLASTISGLSTIGEMSNRRENLGRTQMTRGAAGTPLYMAPEQWEKKKLDARADIYALGCILYEMVNGRFAAQGQTREELKVSHVTGSIKPPDPETPRPILNVLRKCLMARTDQRYNNWKEAVAGFEEAYRNLTGESAPKERSMAEHTREERLAAGESYNTMGMSYFDIGKLDVAILYFEQTVNIARDEKSLELEGRGLGNLGLVYTTMGYMERAIEFHEEHLTIARKIEDPAQEGRALGNLGWVYRQKGDPEKAIRFHQKELTIAQSLSDRYKEAAALHSLGETYRQMGKADQAVKYYQQSLAIARDIGDKTRVERILNSMGKFYLDSGESKEAVALFKQTLDIARKIGDRVGEGEALGNLGDLYYVSGFTDRAIEYYLTALKITSESNDRRKMVRNLHRLGDLYLDMNNEGQALTFYKEGLQISQEIHDQMLELDSFERMGKVYTAKSNYTESAKMYRYALQLTNSLGQLERKQQILVNLAHSYDAWGDFGRAIEYLTEARDMAEAVANWKNVIGYWNEIGLIHVKAKQYLKAENAFQVSLDLSRDHNYLSGINEALNNMGDVLRLMKDPKMALEYYKEAQELARQYNNEAAESTAVANMGLAFHDMGKKWQATRTLEKAVGMAKKSRRSSNVASASYKLADIYCRQNKWDKAEPHAQLALQLYQKMGDEDKIVYLQKLMVTIEKKKEGSSGFLNNIQNLRP